MFKLILKKNSLRNLQWYCVPLVQYFYISAQEEEDAGIVGVLSDRDYIGGMFWAWSRGLGPENGPGAWGPENGISQI